MTNKIKFTVYTAGAIEKATKNEAISWREDIKTKLNCLDIVFYDPVERECQKTGRKFQAQGEYIKGLKQSGHWTLFKEELRKIWFGSIRPEAGHIPDIWTFLRTRKMVDGNEERDLGFWADWEAVLRSDFVIANIDKDIQTIGTIGEILVAYMYKIPVYLIINVPKTEANSTLLAWVLESGGEVFYNTTECVSFIKNKYNLKD